MFTFIVLTFTTLMAAGECVALASPKDVVHCFYDTYISHRESGGLPEGAELARLKPYLSRRLYALIVGALEYREAFIKNHPDEPSKDSGPSVVYKPPFVDGDYFSSLFEGPRSFRIDGVRRRASRYEISVHFWYEAETPGWIDVALVVQERGRYVIDDVIFSGAGPFNPSGRLSHNLKYRPKT